MKVNGLQIRETIKVKKMELAAVLSTFDENLYKFEDEKKVPPIEIMATALTLESDIARLQTLQGEYNLNTPVKIGKNEFTLEYAVKFIGGVSRIAKKWRDAAKGEKVDRYERRSAGKRNKDEERATPTIAKQDSLLFAKEAERLASQIRAAITVGNLSEIELKEIDIKLFE